MNIGKFFRAWMLGALAGFLGAFSAQAFTTNDADTIYSAYNTAFYATNRNGNTHYLNDTTRSSVNYFWGQAEEIEMMEDYYDRTQSPAVKAQVDLICRGFIDSNGSSWSGNIYNDDICWAVIAFSRGYLITGDTTLRDTAKANFDMMFARAWDTNFTGGGLWWSMDRGSKNACIAGPAAIAACYLYFIYGDTNYLQKAQASYAWVRRVLYDPATGAIKDSIAINGTYNNWESSYNQGTFVGAANFLYQITGQPMYFQDAMLATRSLKNSVCSSDGIFPEYGTGDLGGFNGIGARWAARFAQDQNLFWPTFAPWLNANGVAAWNVRNTNNLSWEKWKTPTPQVPANTLAAFDCSDSVIIMQVGLTNAPDALRVTPATGFMTAAQAGVAPLPVSVNLALTNAGTTAVNWSLSTTSTWLKVSSSGGTALQPGAGITVPINLVPSVAAGLPPGRYYANVAIANLTSGAVQNRKFLLAVSSGSAPLTLSGYNARIIAPNTATTAVPGASAFDIPNNYCFFQAGLGSALRGLPTDGVFTSQADGATVFQLQPPGGTNALVLGNSYPASATLTLAAPGAYNSLSILATSANAGGTTGTLVLNFTNGTQSAPLNFTAPDWFSAGTNAAIRALGRLKLSGLSPEDNGTNSPSLFQTTLDLAALGLNQPIASITFTKPANAGATQTIAIMGVSGAAMPEAACIVRQPQSATNNVPAQTTTFSVVAAGVPPLAYQWYYSATGAAGSYTPIASQTNDTLSLANLQSGNAGNFLVVVTNNYGSVTSAVATLAVWRAPVILQQPAPANLALFISATNATWTVVASAALPVNYYWYKNGAPIAGATSATYKINAPQLTDTGTYSVIVSNAFGAVTSRAVSLTVNALPTYPLGQYARADRAMGYWRLDETSGAVAHDYIGGNNGTYTPKVLLGQPGYNLIDTHPAAQFGALAASNSCVTNIPIDFSTTGDGVFTVEAWVNGGTQTTDAGIVTKGYGGGGEQFNLDCGGTGHAFRFFVRNASGTAYLATSGVKPDGQWHHLVGVCDGVNTNVTLYVDGTNAARTLITRYAGILSSTLPMSIGSRQASATAVYNNQFIGLIEEVAVYNYALTANQVSQHYRAAANRAPSFTSNPLTLPAAVAGQAYYATLATNATDPNGDALTFAKVSGPAWLNVAGNGTLTGTPLAADAGNNAFVVRVTDPGNLSASANATVMVNPASPIVLTLTRQDGDLRLNWSGGLAPYQVQTTTDLQNALWQNLGDATSATSLQLSPTNTAGFYRVLGQ